MSASDDALSLKEASVLSGAPEKSIRHELAARVVRSVLEGDVPVVLPTEELVKRVDERIQTLLRGRSRAVSRPEVLGGEPVFEGTRVSVRFVGERAKREPPVTLLEDYPALRSEDVEFARMFVTLGRPPGRPRKKPRFVRGGE
jgi:uncharacterized protein (DUF433 family)